MKNKRLIGIIAALAVLVAGSLIYSSMNKPEAKNEKKVAKVGVLQFVSHPSLDLIYKGIPIGLRCSCALLLLHYSQTEDNRQRRPLRSSRHCFAYSPLGDLGQHLRMSNNHC